MVNGVLVDSTGIEHLNILSRSFSFGLAREVRYGRCVKLDVRAYPAGWLEEGDFSSPADLAYLPPLQAVQNFVAESRIKQTKN